MKRPPMSSVAALILIPVTLAMMALVLLSLGFRPGYATPGGLAITAMKWAICGPLALAGVFLALNLAMPAKFRTVSLLILALPAVLLLALVLWDLGQTGVAGWQGRMIGHHGPACLLFVPLFSILPLASMIYILRQGAVTRPGLAALAASLAATGMGASAYVLHCTDDSPLFMTLWYALALMIVVGLGQLIAKRFLRW
eukprot:gene16326-16503_t